MTIELALHIATDGVLSGTPISIATLGFLTDELIEWVVSFNQPNAAQLVIVNTKSSTDKVVFVAKKRKR